MSKVCDKKNPAEQQSIQRESESQFMNAKSGLGCGMCLVEHGLGLLRAAEPVTKLVALHLGNILFRHAEGDEALLLGLDACAFRGTLLFRADAIFVTECTGCHDVSSCLYVG